MSVPFFIVTLLTPKVTLWFNVVHDGSKNDGKDIWNIVCYNQTMLEFETYIDFLCDLLTIDKPTILYEQTDIFTMPKTAGMRSFPAENTILVNLSIYKDGLEYVAITHEMRHIYQYQVVSQFLTDLESKSTIREWRKGFNNYKDSTHEHYENQSLEVDANAFAWYITKVLTGREIVVNCDRHALARRIRQIASDMPADEILEVYSYFANKNRSF